MAITLLLLDSRHARVFTPIGVIAISRGARSAPQVSVASYRSDPVGVDNSRGARHPVVSLRSTTG